MIPVEDFLADLLARKVRLWMDDGNLHCNAPKGVLTADLLKQVSERRQELSIVLGRPGTAARSNESIPRIPAGAAPVLSSAQQRLWFLDQILPGSSAYTMRDAIRLRGRLDLAALRNSFRAIVSRHDVLRTTFDQRVGDEQDGEPLQRIHPPPAAWDIAVEDLTHLDPEAQQRAIETIGAAEARRVFDLRHDWPMQTRLARLAPDHHVLFLTMHHIASDGWSMGVIVREMGALYTAFVRNAPSPLPPCPIQYADFAHWQHARLETDALLGQLQYWTERLAGAPMLDLPTDFPRPATPSFSGGSVTHVVGGRTRDALTALARQEGATLFMILLAAVQILLARCTGQDDVCVGTPLANRLQRETEGLIGFFVNTLVMRTNLAGSPDFRALLAQVRETALGAYANQELPFERIVEALQPERNFGRTPLFQVSFALQNAPMSAAQLPDLSIETVELETQSTRFELEFHCWEQADGLRFVIFYNRDLFAAATAQRLLLQLERLLEAIAEDPATPIDRMPLLTRTERRQLIDGCNQTARPFPADALLPDLFAAQAARFPELPAVIAGSLTVRYAELAVRAHRIARRLIALGVGPGDLVGVCLRRTPDLPATLLGVQAAGAAYVPLDPDYPPERLAYMATDSRAAAILATRETVRRLPEGAAPLVLIDDPAALAGLSDAPVPQVERRRRLRPDDLAYVIYTSGSTGRPKGVMVTQRGVVHYIDWAIGEFGLGPGRGAPVNTSFAFDATVLTLNAPLYAGAPVTLIPEGDHELSALAVALAEHRGFAVVKVTPTHLELLNQLMRPDRADGATAAIAVGGEALDGAALAFWRRHAPNTRLCNEYGPTEITIGCSLHTVSAADPEAGPIPIGGPNPNYTMYVLDRRLQPVPIGVAGELFVGGVGVSRGYQGRPELTAERFIADPFAPRGARLYRTGDRVRRQADGNLIFVGRLDHQAKIRGFRAEPAEIEAALRRQPEVRQAAALVHDGPSGHPAIAAFVVLAPAGDANGLAGGHVEAWRELYEDTYAKERGVGDPAFNIVGWNSSYDGQPIPPEEMHEQVEAVVARILALQPQHVLEIGSGTGLLMARIAPHCVSYLGTDFSANAIWHARQQIASRPDLGHVVLQQRMADDLSGIPPGSADVVILNSVVQYFPGLAYLRTVIDRAIPLLRPGGSLFIGDVRAHPLLAAFHASVEFARQPMATSRQAFARRVRRGAAEEKELLVAPDFFHALRHLHPAIAEVQVQLKRGRHVNEMNGFRYDAVLTTGAAATGAVSVERVDWRRGRPDAAAIRGLLMARPPLLSLENVPNARLAMARATLDWAEDRRLEPVLSALRAALRRQPPPGIDPDLLYDLGEREGYAVRVTYTRDDATCCDAVFSRDGVIWPRAAPPPSVADWQRFANDPLRRDQERRAGQALRQRLASWLPAPMLPSVVVIVEQIPVTGNGKLDRAALLELVGERRETRGARPPQTATERALAAIWEEYLRRDRLSADDDFFDLGGHSLLATQIVGRIRARFAIELPVRAIFETPALHALAARIDALRWVAAPPERVRAPREEGVI